MKYLTLAFGLIQQGAFHLGARHQRRINTFGIDREIPGGNVGADRPNAVIAR